MSTFDKVRSSFETASLQQRALTEAIINFQAAAACRDWAKAEEMRANALGALDGFFDNFAAAHRALDG